MEENLYKNIRKNWNFLHPVNKILTAIDYFVERVIRTIRQYAKTKWKSSLRI